MPVASGAEAEAQEAWRFLYYNPFTTTTITVDE